MDRRVPLVFAMHDVDVRPVGLDSERRLVAERLVTSAARHADVGAKSAALASPAFADSSINVVPTTMPRYPTMWRFVLRLLANIPMLPLARCW